MPYGKPKMYGKPKSAGLKALAAKNKNLTYTGPAMSGGGPKKVGSQERYNDSPFNYKAQVMMADMPMMYGAGKPKNTDPDSKDGVTVTGDDKRKSAEQARKERMDAAKKKREDAAMKKKIAKANKIEELKFKLEERKARAAAKRQRLQTKKDKLTGRVDPNAEDTSTNY